ncbi:MAG TPA: methyl-accepting chemotaxis protein [Pseudoxanthomonas sp.]|nr:methyl-accepting chemotaxis protein [Pseudoxanthomonas sp.]
MATSNTTFFGSIRGRLLFGTSALALIPLILLTLALGYYATRSSGEALNQRAYDQMQSIRTGKQAEVGAYFDNVRNLVRVVANTTEVRQALVEGARTQPQLADTLPVDLQQARNSLVGYYRNDFGKQFAQRNPGRESDISPMVASLPPQAVAAQYLYISANPNPLGKKGELLQAADGSPYSAVHASIHGYAGRIVQSYGLYDFFLVDAQTGTLVYTYFKELDFATSLRNGPWAKSGLGQAYAAAMAADNPDDVLITDYAPYLPSYDDQASFVSTPIVENGRTIGVFIVQLPIDRLNQIMTFNGQWDEVGLGESGETYLVGPDKTPRSISRFMKEDSTAFVNMMRGLNTPQQNLQAMASRNSNIGLMTVNTQGVNAALGGTSGTAIYSDYRGIPVLGSYAPLDVLGLRWAILSEIDGAEAQAPVTALQRGITIVALVGLALVGVVALWLALRLARSINRPLSQVQDTVLKVGAGDLKARTGMRSSDEIGQLATAFDGMLDEKVAELARAQAENEQLNNSVVEIMTSVAQLAQRDLDVRVPVSEDVTGAVADAINMMTRSTATALHQVNRISRQVSDSSERVRERSETVGKLAGDASDQANAASEELSSTAMALRQMGDQAQNAGRDAERALSATGDALNVVKATVEGITASRDQIRETEKRVKRLAERSQEISSAVSIIGQIAERTSVLALNASMQAVAAGEAGRGFAVVADEVKRLAENAREATQQIAGLVGAIQSDTTETLQAMNGTIAQVVDITRLADRAGTQMNDTRQATEALANSVKSIAQATQTQGKASQRLLTRAYDLISASQRTLEEIEQQRGDTQTLTDSASALVSTVSEFRLPAA